MKKALPVITLLAILAVIGLCIVGLVIEVPINTLTISILAACIAVVAVLFVLTIVSGTKEKKGDLTAKEDPASEPDAPVEAVSAEAEPEAAPAETEPEAAPTENEPEAAPAEDAESTAGNEVDVTQFSKSRYVRSYSSKLIQSDDELKGYYSIIKNAFMSYKKVSSIVSREHERIRLGRSTIGVIKLRGKTIMLYLALDPAQFEGTMYAGEDVSAMSKYADTPFLYRVNGPRKASRAARLIAMVAEKLEMETSAQPANEDYVALLPYESDEALIEKGLIVDTEAETASV